MKVLWGAVAKQTGWKLGYLDAAVGDAGFLSEVQYDYLVGQFKDMAQCADPMKCPTVDVEAIGDEIFELKDKGGILGKLNVRVYFLMDGKKKMIVVLSVYKKEDEGMIPRWLKKRLSNRRTIVKAALAKK